jgi:enoyl-CoA hydratase
VLDGRTAARNDVDVLNIEDQGGVAVVRIHHGKVNALDAELLERLITTVGELTDVDGVVLTGTGRAFSAGVDLKRVVDGGADYVERFLAALSGALLAVFDHPRPVVAAVNGHAIAGGCVLAAACDVRLMSAGSIGLTELAVGVPFPVAALEIMRHVLGPAAQSFVLGAGTIDAAQAEAAGLVDEVVDPDLLVDQAVRRAAGLARMPWETFSLAKRQLHRETRARIGRYRPVDDPVVAELWDSAPVREAMARFVSQLRNAGQATD